MADGKEAAGIAEPAVEKAEPAVEKMAAPVSLELRSEPSGALVLVGDKVTGKTPLDLAFPSDQSTLEVLLRLEGYATVRRTLSREEDDPITISLWPEAKPPPEKKVVKKRPRPRKSTQEEDKKKKERELLMPMW